MADNDQAEELRHGRLWRPLAMSKEEVATLIESWDRELPERLTGNEANEIIASRMANLVRAQRSTVVELLRDWIAVRVPKSQRQPDNGAGEGAMWLALEVARRYALDELGPDIEALIADVRAGKTYLPYYADMISRYLPRSS